MVGQDRREFGLQGELREDRAAEVRQVEERDPSPGEGQPASSEGGRGVEAEQFRLPERAELLPGERRVPVEFLIPSGEVEP
jgi:hypothetical protein